MSVRSVPFGVIGAGMMGRHFAATAARWGELFQPAGQPDIVAVCNRSQEPRRWFQERLPQGTQYTDDYHAVLANPLVQCVYVAVPHAFHQAVAVAAMRQFISGVTAGAVKQ